jgi:hypothetical protein
MDYHDIKTFENLENFLRSYSVDNGHYDPGGIFHLISALVDNLATHGIKADPEDYMPCAFRVELIAFLKKMIRCIEQSNNTDCS